MSRGMRPADYLTRCAELEELHRSTVATRSGLSRFALLHISELLMQIADVEISDIRETAVDHDGNGLVGTPEWSAFMHTTDIVEDANRLAGQLQLMARSLRDAKAVTA